MKLFPKYAGPFPYLWIIMIFPQYLYNSWQADGLTGRLIGIAAGIVLLYTFRQMYWLGDTGMLLHFLLGVTAMSVAAIAINPGMLSFTIIIASSIGYLDRLEDLAICLEALVFAYLAVSVVVTGNLTGMFDLFVLLFFILQLICPIIIFVYRRSQQLHHQLDDANERIAALVREQERSRLARDLHDTLGHTLTMVIMKSELASRLVARDQERAKNEILEIEKITRSALQETRELVSSMRHRSLQDELEEARAFLEEKGVAATIKRPDKWPMLRAVDETMLALTVREAVTNVVRHSGAARCLIQANADQDRLVINIDDDGIGMNKLSITGNGLHTMMERMKLIGGTTDVLPAEKGTQVRFTLPLHKEKEGEGA